MPETIQGAEKDIRKTTIYAGIMIAIMISGHFIPAPEPLTRMGMQIIAVYAAMIFGWCTCGMLWPSLMGIVGLGFTEYVTSIEGAMGLMLTDNTFLSMLVAFIFFAFILRTGLFDIIAQWLVTRKFAAGKPWLFMSFFFVIAGFLATVFPMAVLMIVIFTFMSNLFTAMGYTKDDMFPTYFFLGIGLFAGLGSLLIPFFPNAYIIAGMIRTSLGGESLSLFQWIMVVDVPIFASWILYLLIGKFVIRVDTSRFCEHTEVLLKAAEQTKRRMTEEETYAAVFLVAFVVLAILQNIVPAESVLGTFFSKIGVIGLCVILTIAVLVLPKKTGKPLAKFAELTGGVSWGMLLLVGGIMVVSKALTSQGTGVAEWMVMYIVPLIQDAPFVLFVALITIVLCIFSQFAMNMVLTMLFAPLLAPVAVACGYNPLCAVMAVMLGAKLAFLAPSGSMPAAMVFGQTEWVKAKNIYRICIPWIVVTICIFIVMSIIVPDLVYPVY